MNLENSKIKVEGNRVIGLKSDDMNKLAEAYSKKESSFQTNPSVVTEPMIQDQPLVEVVPEIMDGVANEQEIPNVAPELQVETPQYVQPIMPEVAPTPEAVQNPVIEPNIFDIPVAEPTPVMETPQIMPTPEVAPVQNIQEEVQGGVSTEIPTELDTPQNFFDKVEGPSNDKIITEETVNQNRMDSFGDPAIIMLDNLKDTIESKNAMIKALNDKINLLEGELKKANEAKQISEAQRVAAEQTLANARNAEMPSANGGPTLTYNVPTPQNYNQAA